MRCTLQRCVRSPRTAYFLNPSGHVAVRCSSRAAPAAVSTPHTYVPPTVCSVGSAGPSPPTVPAPTEVNHVVSRALQEGDWQRGAQLLRGAVRIGCVPPQSTYVAVIQAVATSGGCSAAVELINTLGTSRSSLTAMYNLAADVMQSNRGGTSSTISTGSPRELGSSDKELLGLVQAAIQQRIALSPQHRLALFHALLQAQQAQELVSLATALVSCMRSEAREVTSPATLSGSHDTSQPIDCLTSSELVATLQAAETTTDWKAASLFMSHWLDVSSAGSTAAIPSEALVYCLRTYADALQGEDTESIPWQRVAALAEQCTSNAQHGGDEAVTAALERLKAAAAASSCLEPSISTIGSADADSFVLRKLFLLDRPHENVRAAAAELALPMGLVPRLLRAAIPLLARDAHNSQGPSTYERWVHVVMFLMHLSSKSELQSRGTEDLQLAELFPHPDLVVGSSSEAMPLWKYLIQHLASHGDECHLETVDVAPKLRLIIWLLHYTRYTDQWYARNAKMAVLTDIADPQQSSSEAAEHGNLLHAREKLLDELYYAMTTRQQTYAIAVQRLLLEVVREVTLSSWMDSPQPSRDNMWHRLCVKLLLAGGAPDALEAGITTIADAVVASSKILTPSDWIPLLDYHRALLQEGVAHAQVFKELEATFRRYHAWEAALAYSDTHRELTQDTAPLRRCVIPLLLEAGQWELVLSHLPPPEGRTTSDRLSAFVAQKGIIEAAIESSVREKNADAVLRGVQSIHELQSVVEASGVLAEQAGGGALQWTASMHSDIAVSCALLFVELGCGEEAVTMVEVLERGGATASGTNASSATLVLGLQAYRRAFVEGVASISCTARDPPTSNPRDRPLIQVCFASCGMFHHGDAITAFRILADNLRADDVDAPAADASSTFAQHSWVTNGEALIRNAPPPVLGACSGLFFILAAIVERMVKQICMECDATQSPQSCSSHAKDVEGVARVLIAWACTEEQVLVCSSMLRDAWMLGATGDEVSGVLIRLGRDLVQVVLVKNIPVRDEVIHLVQVLTKMKIPDNLELSELHELVKRRSHRAAEEVVAEVANPTAFHRCVVVAHRLAEEYSTLHRDDDAVRVLDDLGEALFDIPSADSEIFNPAAVLRIVARSMDGRQARMDEAKKVVSSVLSAASPATTQRHFHTAIRCCVASGQWSTSFLLLCRLLSRHPLHSNAGVTLVAEEAALMSLVLQCMGKHAPWTSALRSWAHLQDLMPDGVAQALPISSSASAMASLCAGAPPGTDAYHVVQLMQLAHKFGFSISSEMFDLLLSQLTKALLVTPSEYAVQAHAIATVTDFLGHARVERFMNGISAEAAMDATTPIMDDGAFPLTVDRTWMPAARPLLTPQEVHLLAQRAPETVTATATQLECLAAKQFGGRLKPLELPLLLRLYSQEVLQALQTPSLRGDGVDSPSLDSLRNSPLVWLMLSDILHRHAQSCGGGWLTTYTADWCGEALVEHVCVAWDGFMSSATAKQLWAECPMNEIENLVRGRWSPLAEEELRDEVRRRKGKPPLRLVTAPHFTRKDISRYWACYHRLLAPEMHFNGLELCCLAQYIPTIQAIRVRCKSDLPARDQAMWEVASAVQLGHFHEAVIPADDLLAGIRRRKSVQAILSMYTVAHKLLSSLNEELRTDAHNPHDSAFALPSNHGLTPSYRLVPTSELSTIRKGTRLHLVATVMHLQDTTVHPTIPGRGAVAPLSSARPYQLLRAAALDLLAAHHVEGQTIGPTSIQKLLEASTSWKTEAAAYYERLHSHTLPDAAAWRRAVEVVSEELRCQSPSWARAAEQLVARGRPAPPAYPMEECLCQLRDSALRVTLRALHQVCQQQPSPGYLPDSLSLLLLEVLRRYLSSDCGVDLTPAPSFAFTMNDQRDAEERRMADLLWLCRGLSAGGVWEQLRPAHADAIGRLVGPLRRSTSNRRGSGA